MNSIQNIAPQPSFTDHAKNELIQSAREVAAQHQPNQVETTHGRQIATDTSSTSGTPSTGAREAVLSPYEQQKKMVEERLADREDYQDAKNIAGQYDQVMQDFLLVEANSPCPGDNVVTLADLKVVAEDGLRPSYVRDAANRLLSNQKVWTGMAKGDDRVSSADVVEFFANMKTKMKDIKTEVTAEVKDEIKANAPKDASGSSATASGSSSATSSPEALFKAPTPSTKPGLEGAAENATRALQAIGDASRDIMAKIMDPKTPADERQKLQAQFNELAQLQQMLTAMFEQLNQAISNTMKMYSGAAQNSIQNMR
jgi:hypothetical protein